MLINQNVTMSINFASADLIIGLGDCLHNDNDIKIPPEIAFCFKPLLDSIQANNSIIYSGKYENPNSWPDNFLIIFLKAFKRNSIPSTQTENYPSTIAASTAATCSSFYLLSWCENSSNSQLHKFIHDTHERKTHFFEGKCSFHCLKIYSVASFLTLVDDGSTHIQGQKLVRSKYPSCRLHSLHFVSYESELDPSTPDQGQRLTLFLKPTSN